MKVGIIRVLTTDNQQVLQEHSKLLKHYYGIESESRCIPDQLTGIFDDASEEKAVPKIVELGKQYEKEGFDAIFLSCAADPGLQKLRAAVSIPVISAGSASARIAALMKLPTAVIGIGAEAPKPFKKYLGDDVLYERPEGVRNTTDLLKPEGKRNALAMCQRLYDSGIKVIAFSCTGFSTIDLSSAIREELGGVAVDAVQAAGLFISEIVTE